jgi:hypothetical protein
MAKSQLATVCPENIEREVEEYKEKNNISSKSEATRQLLERGVSDWRGESYADIAVNRSFEISGIASFLSIVIGWSLSSSGLLRAGGVFAVVCILFGGLWIMMNADQVRSVIRGVVADG